MLSWKEKQLFMVRSLVHGKDANTKEDENGY